MSTTGEDRDFPKIGFGERATGRVEGELKTAKVSRAFHTVDATILLAGAMRVWNRIGIGAGIASSPQVCLALDPALLRQKSLSWPAFDNLQTNRCWTQSNFIWQKHRSASHGPKEPGRLACEQTLEHDAWG